MVILSGPGSWRPYPYPQPDDEELAYELWITRHWSRLLEQRVAQRVENTLVLDVEVRAALVAVVSYGLRNCPQGGHWVTVELAAALGLVPTFREWWDREKAE